MAIDVIEYLERKKEQNLPAILAKKRGAEAVVCEPGGVILYEAAIDLYYISLDDNALLERNWRNPTAHTEYLVLREKNIEAIEERIRAKNVNNCRQIVFPGNPVELPERKDLEIRPLDIGNLDFVCDHYRMHLDRAYIAARIGNGQMFGAYDEGKLAGFAGRHSDGSMGMLEILPEYRRLGIGSYLGRFLINSVVVSGEIPYAHVLPDNAASLAMTGGLPGAAFTEELVSWMA